MEKGLTLTTPENAVVLIEDRGGAGTTFRHYGPGPGEVLTSLLSRLVGAIFGD